jgi:uncharacterized membrane-anchored protein YjiN (DUF445 family)
MNGVSRRRTRFADVVRWAVMRTSRPALERGTSRALERGPGPGPERPVIAPPERQAGATRLRRMKVNATALLVLAAAIYVATVTVPGWHGGVHGFVQAGAEAAMVGGLADWFAVTALFRHPLRLPIPHTALIPRQKDELATKLGEFVTGYFLTPEALQEQVAEAAVITRLGAWLSEPDHARSVARELASAAGGALDALDADGVVEGVLDILRRDQAKRSYAPIIGRLLTRGLEGGAQRPLIDVLAEQARIYLTANAETLRPTIKRFVEERNWVAWVVTTDRLVNRLIRDLIKEVGDIESSPDHPLRIALEAWLHSVAEDLQSNRVTVFKVDRSVGRLLDDPKTKAVVGDIVRDAIAAVRDSLGDPHGEAVGRVAALVGSLGRRMIDDARFHDQLQSALEDVIGHVVRRYGQALTQLIRRQVGAWPAADASRRIELAVGRDLQFIRINGTAVGALAGLAIHAVTLLL